MYFIVKKSLYGFHSKCCRAQSVIFFGQTRLEISPVALLEPVRLTPKARPMRKKKREAQTTFHSFSHLCKKNEEIEDGTSHKKWGKRRWNLTQKMRKKKRGPHTTFASWRPWARWSRGEGRWQFHQCVQPRCTQNQCHGSSDRRHSRSRKQRSKRLMLSSTPSSTFPQQQTEADFSETYRMLDQGCERKENHLVMKMATSSFQFITQVEKLAAIRL